VEVFTSYIDDTERAIRYRGIALLIVGAFTIFFAVKEIVYFWWFGYFMMALFLNSAGVFRRRILTYLYPVLAFAPIIIQIVFGQIELSQGPFAQANPWPLLTISLFGIGITFISWIHAKMLFQKLWASEEIYDLVIKNLEKGKAFGANKQKIESDLVTMKEALKNHRAERKNRIF